MEQAKPEEKHRKHDDAEEEAAAVTEKQQQGQTKHHVPAMTPHQAMTAAATTQMSGPSD